MDSPNLINKKIEVGLFIIENCYNNFLLKTQIEGKNPSYEISRDKVDLFDPFGENDSTTENVEFDLSEDGFIPDPPPDDEPLDLADPPPDDKPPKIARPSPARLSGSIGKTFEVKVVPTSDSPVLIDPLDEETPPIIEEPIPIEVTEKEKIEEILYEVALIAEDEFALQFETVSEDIEVVELAKERIKDYLDRGISWKNSAEFEIIEDNDLDIYFLTSDLLNTSKTFNWCGAFIAFCYKDFIKEEIRKKYMSSTYRFAVFAQETERHLGVQSLIKETSEVFQKQVFQISNNEKLSQEEKTEKINAGIKVVKENLNKVFLKGYVVAMLPTKEKWYGSHFGIILNGEVYAEIIDPETGEISETGDGDLYFFLDVIEGNVSEGENIFTQSVRKIARNIQDIFAVYRFLPEDYIFNFKKEEQKVFDNAEIIIKEID